VAVSPSRGRPQRLPCLAAATGGAEKAGCRERQAQRSDPGGVPGAPMLLRLSWDPSGAARCRTSGETPLGSLRTCNSRSSKPTAPNRNACSLVSSGIRSHSILIPAKRSILHLRIAEVLPLLQKIDPQQPLRGSQVLRRERIGRASSTLGTGLGIVGLDPINQCSPRLHLLHLTQEARASAMTWIFSRGWTGLSRVSLTWLNTKPFAQ
jgi:hypothetical protein